MIAKCGTVIIGYGGMGAGYTSSSLKPWRKLTLLGSVRHSSRQKPAGGGKGLHAYSSFEEVLNDPQVDLVTVAIPNDQHRIMYCIQAMEAGKTLSVKSR